MSRIVRERFPVEDLPEDLRAGFSEHAFVRVVIEPSRSDVELMAELDSQIARGIADLVAGRIVAAADVRKELRTRFGPERHAAE